MRKKKDELPCAHSVKTAGDRCRKPMNCGSCRRRYAGEGKDLTLPISRDHHRVTAALFARILVLPGVTDSSSSCFAGLLYGHSHG